MGARTSTWHWIVRRTWALWEQALTDRIRLIWVSTAIRPTVMDWFMATASFTQRRVNTIHGSLSTLAFHCKSQASTSPTDQTWIVSEFSSCWCARSVGHSIARVRPKHSLGAGIWSSEIVDLAGSKLTCPTLLIVGEQKFTRDNRHRSRVFPILDIVIRSADIRDRTLNLSQIAPNFARFSSQNFLRRTPRRL